MEHRNRTVFGGFKPIVETFVIDEFLAGDISAECFSCEEAVETFSVVYVGFSVEEDPICVFEDFLAGIDNAGLDVVG